MTSNASYIKPRTLAETLVHFKATYIHKKYLIKMVEELDILSVTDTADYQLLIAVLLHDRHNLKKRLEVVERALNVNQPKKDDTKDEHR